MSAGKGSKPRNCFSKDFKKNYEKIDWKEKESTSFEKSKKLHLLRKSND